MSDDTTMACPECDSARIGRNGGLHTKSHYCHECLARFEEPVERPVRTGGIDPRGGLAKRLLDADPDDVSADP